MFNIDKAISNWRGQMLAAGIKSSNALDELQEHLRSDIEQQMQSGSDAETAFCNAISRIGSATRVHEEFKKVRPRVGFAFEKWMAAGVALLFASTLAFSALAFSILHMGIIQQIVGLAGIAVILLVACAWRYLLPRVPVVKSSSIRFCLYVLFFALAFLCPAGLAWLVETRIDPSSTAYVVAMIWVAVPMPVLIWLAQSFMMDRDARTKWGMISATSNHKELYV